MQTIDLKQKANIVLNYSRLKEVIQKASNDGHQTVTTDFLPPIILDKLTSEGFRFDVVDDKIVVAWGELHSQPS